MKTIAVPVFVLVVLISLFFSWPITAWADSHQSGPEQQSLHEALPPEAPSSEAHGESHGDELGRKLPLWTVVPFVGILLSIAVFPLIAPHFWHGHFPKVSAFWALLFAVPFVYVYHGTAIHQILHIYLIDYFPFIILLWALFTIAGGIVVRGSLQGKPIVNSVLLLIGTALASWVGTTGAAMIMIRPVLRANASRKKKAHIVCFFIFLVANIGGSLTPLGDPPLFLGFLHGVPFFWTMHLVPHMLLVSVLLLVTFFFFDTFYYRREKTVAASSTKEDKEPIRVEGWHNFFFLAGVVASVLMSGTVKLGEISVWGIAIPTQNLLRDLVMISMGISSLVSTKAVLREANEFSWFPIKEVAYLFAGIFMTIIPALAILQAGSEGALAFLLRAVKEPYHYFWMTGILSSFLDNAPTYLTFFNSALGKLQISEPMVRQALGYVAGGESNPLFIQFLEAISAGAVFMGANTYIGNAPNFMVKSIAEESGIAMPSFFGYMVKYSIPILIPLFIIVTFVFF